MGKTHESVEVVRLPNCDFCQIEGRETPAAYDGKTVHGPWANMCELCFTKNGIGLGLGRGQRLLLKKVESGEGS